MPYICPILREAINLPIYCQYLESQEPILSNPQRDLGTDLEADHPGNSLWHTGNAVPLDGGDYWERMPWEYQDRVTFGRSLGVGRAGRPQSWRERVNDFIDGHLFSM